MVRTARRRGIGSFTAAIPQELYVVLFSFLLNFVWEMWQIRFFQEIANEPHWYGVLVCTKATFGDAAISLFAFWVVAIVGGSRVWIAAPTWTQVGGFIAVGVLVTLLFEALATGPLERWQYNSLMPKLPLLGTGVLPLLQWLLLPPVVVWLARNQIRGQGGTVVN